MLRQFLLAVYSEDNQHGICPRCRHTVQYKAIGKAGHVVTDRYIMYLSYWQKHPYIEKIVKAGLYELASECLWGYELDVRSTEPSLTKMLMLDKRLLKRLRDNDGGKAYLRWLQYEKCMRDPLSEETIAWLIQQNIAPRDIEFISHKMSVTQIRHYIQRQMQEGKMRLREVLTTWSDYLCMATRLGIEHKESYVLFLRRTSEADKPHYTLEVEPGGTIRQVRTKFDRQEGDLGDASECCRKTI